MKLLAELRRRNVIRMAGLYLVGAWLIIQIAETLLPAFDVPGWVLRAIIIVLALGFVPALIFSWVFELTPDGIRRDAEVERSEAITQRTARKLDIAVIVLLLGVGVLLLWRYDAPEPATPSVDSDAAATDVSTASVAVLAFANMSPEAENEYFADGISEELLNVFARVEGLRVASRTSAFSFKGKDTPIPEIARTLGVRHVLEGSVRKQGQRVRITAQLIDSQTDGHLWSQSYDRELADIFAVQEEIAQAIAGELQGVLGVRRISVPVPTADLEAYERFLRGRGRFYRRVELDEAIADLRFAVERDPSFTEAWAFLGAASFVVSNGGYPTGLDRPQLLADAIAATEKALSLDPGVGLALGVKGQLFTTAGSTEKLIEGIRLLEDAAERVTADSSARLWLGMVWLQLGHVERGLPHLQRAYDQDPLVAINNGWLGLALATQGRWQEGTVMARRAVELSDLPFWSSIIASGLANAGRNAEARDLLAATRTVGSDAGDAETGEALLAGLLAALDDPARRPAYVAAIEALDPTLRWEAAPWSALLLRDSDRAFADIERHGAQMRTIVSAWLPPMGWLREDPRFFALMQEEGIVGFWEQQGFPDGCRPVTDPGGRRLDCSGYGP